MIFHTTMPKKMVPYFENELKEANAFLVNKNFQKSWYHLERAHIIGQKYPFEHTYVHWKMLQFGFIIKSTNEVMGQIPRLLVGGVKSFVGHIPAGNTGGANVPPLKSMNIPNDIQKIINDNL